MIYISTAKGRYIMSEKILKEKNKYDKMYTDLMFAVWFKRLY